MSLGEGKTQLGAASWVPGQHRTLGSVKAKPHKELSGEALFLWTAVCVSQYRTRLHTGTLHDAGIFSISQSSSFELMWSAESSCRNCFPDTEFHCKVLWYLWNRNVVANLTAFKISTITSNAIKLAFSLLWAQLTWGHWSKARLYLCLCIAHSGDQGKKSHSIGDVLDPTRYENHNTHFTNVLFASFHHVLFLHMSFTTSLVHTSIQRHANWCRFRSRSLHLCKVRQAELQNW